MKTNDLVFFLSLSLLDSYFYHAILLVLEYSVRLFNLAERETMGDERSGIYLALRYKL